MASMKYDEGVPSARLVLSANHQFSTRIRRRNGSTYNSLLGRGSGTRNRPIASGDNGPCCHESPRLFLSVTSDHRG
jgi:hypothetical protein